MSLILNALKRAEDESIDQQKENQPVLKRNSGSDVSLSAHPSGYPLKIKQGKPTGSLVIGLLLAGAIAAMVYFAYARYHQPVEFGNNKGQSLNNVSEKPKSPDAASHKTTALLPDRSRPLNTSQNAAFVKTKPEAIIEPKQIFHSLEKGTLKIQAILWDMNPKNRIIVINDKVLYEKEIVLGYQVVEIKKDHVILHASGLDYKLEKDR